jgi:hypothetical protein
MILCFIMAVIARYISVCSTPWNPRSRVLGRLFPSGCIGWLSQGRSQFKVIRSMVGRCKEVMVAVTFWDKAGWRRVEVYGVEAG